MRRERESDVMVRKEGLDEVKDGEGSDRRRKMRRRLEKEGLR